MGYTNYIKYDRFADSEWNEFTKRAAKVFATTPVKLGNWQGTRRTKPEIKPSRVSFNGVAEDAHETCLIDKSGEEFSFCKTAGKPYDEVVVAIYKLVREVLGSHRVELSSDGGKAVFDDYEDLTSAEIKEASGY